MLDQPWRHPVQPCAEALADVHLGWWGAEGLHSTGQHTAARVSVSTRGVLGEYLCAGAVGNIGCPTVPLWCVPGATFADGPVRAGGLHSTAVRPGAQHSTQQPGRV